MFVIHRKNFKMGSVLIESRLVGKLIGPRGATIQQLQSEYNVHISISKEDDAVSFFTSFPFLEAKNNADFFLWIFRKEIALLKSVELTKTFRAQLLLSKKDSASQEVEAVDTVAIANRAATNNATTTNKEVAISKVAAAATDKTAKKADNNGDNEAAVAATVVETKANNKAGNLLV